ncbi:GNAT family N-acetyltransferase [Entomobacter blattae]|uniref:L-methionine sulfoximine/L-methionine sulfone acetyltransferase n=1 Tax=Entomobacter blattae TaxID=2762277 RepID=A0A7H1NSA4_9PROT|nr:GNAT family N-acetyltransferase [Entomobacter blattae]QNT78664.1 L-methionine sulfoximine/L-methionine sulfone acetyltransferase [Entomobacter blattae]
MPYIRNATLADIPFMTRVINHAILHSNALWEEEPVTEKNRQEWLDHKHQQGFPVFIIQKSPHDPVAGFGTYGPFRPHAGYALSIEHSLYIATDQQGKGYGKALLQHLLQTATVQNFHIMIGGLSADNTASIALHKQAGFTAGSTIPQAGRKFGQFLDLVFMYKLLQK